MKLIAISDTHHKHEELGILPNGDVLIHAGDATMIGELPYTLRFLKWFASQPHKYKVFVPGNHDFSFDTQASYDKWKHGRGYSYQDINKNRQECIEFCKNNGITVLMNSSVEIEDISFYGIPDTPVFFDWAFNKNFKEMQDICDNIPLDTKILISHGPPYGILDLTKSGQNVGCQNIANKIKQLANLKAHIFGHIHEGYGQIEKDGIKYVNASSCNASYKIRNNPIEIFI